MKSQKSKLSLVSDMERLTERVTETMAAHRHFWQRVWPYVSHRKDCSINYGPADVGLEPVRKCSCGLDAVSRIGLP